MSAKRILALTIAALVASAVLAASASAAPVKPTGYQLRSHWLSLPGKSVKQKKVAVFYVYPTSYSRVPGGPIYATIDASAPPYFMRGGLPMGVLHTFDYPLYFFSVRANAADRVAQYFAGN